MSVENVLLLHGFACYQGFRILQLNLICSNAKLTYLHVVSQVSKERGISHHDAFLYFNFLFMIMSIYNIVLRSLGGESIFYSNRCPFSFNKRTDDLKIMF